MPRFITILLLAAFGIALAQDLFGAHAKLFQWVVRNPATIALTELVHATVPEPLFQFEQDCLRNLYLMPYLVLGGILAGFSLGLRSAAVGVSLPLAYVIWSNYLLLKMASTIETLYWHALLPGIIWSLSLVTMFVFAAATGHWLRSPFRLSCSVSDILLATTFFALLLFGIITRIYLAIPLSIFIGTIYLAYRGSSTVLCQTEMDKKAAATEVHGT